MEKEKKKEKDGQHFVAEVPHKAVVQNHEKGNKHSRIYNHSFIHDNLLERKFCGSLSILYHDGRSGEWRMGIGEVPAVGSPLSESGRAADNFRRPVFTYEWLTFGFPFATRPIQDDKWKAERKARKAPASSWGASERGLQGSVSDLKTT